MSAEDKVNELIQRATLLSDEVKHLRQINAELVGIVEQELKWIDAGEEPA